MAGLNRCVEELPPPANFDLDMKPLTLTPMDFDAPPRAISLRGRESARDPCGVRTRCARAVAPPCDGLTPRHLGGGGISGGVRSQPY